jgi:hypothetical protein
MKLFELATADHDEGVCRYLLTFAVFMCVMTLSCVLDQEKIRGGSLIAVA